MTILVTGASGFLGTALVERLLAPGDAIVRCLVRGSSGRDHLESLRRIDGRGRLQLHQGCLDTTEAVVDVVRGAGLVFHLVAGMRGSAEQVHHDTIGPSKHLIAAIATLPPDARPKVVLVSSLAVYGVAGLPRGTVIDEDTPLESQPERRDPYTRAKLEQERLFREGATTWAFPLVVARPGILHGPGRTGIPDRVGIEVGRVFVMVAGANLLPLSDVHHCADALAFLGERFEAVGRTFNIVDADPPRARDYLGRCGVSLEGRRVIPVPYVVMLALGHTAAIIRRVLPGGLPGVPTPYRMAARWAGHRFTARALTNLGWRPPDATAVRRR